MKKIIIIGLAVILIAGGFILYKNAASAKMAKNEKTVKPRKGDIVKQISASGKIKAGNEVTLQFQTSGMLSWVGVKEGDSVKAGQAIAQLDTRLLQNSLLQSLRDYSKKRWDFEEDKNVTYQNKVINDTIKRILEKNQFDLDKAVADVENSDITLKYAVIITPISGIVTHIDSPIAGVNVTPAGANFVISDPQSTVFKADIDETDIGNVKVGQNVIISLDAYPGEKINGAVQNIAFTQVTTSGGGTAYQVTITLPDNTSRKFKVGMNGDCNIIIKKINNVLILPVETVIKDHGQIYVYILDESGNKLKKEITLGLETDDQVEIKGGLEEKSKVVVPSK